ncbi:MAG: hypothetical protein LBU87_02655 [Lactobacillales bacterium]|jgi:hypothetical protein|nr:hypothetical protein [Lactobacillales bacterium]
MRIATTQTLIIGGLYLFFSSFFSLFENSFFEYLRETLFILFFVAMVVSLLNKKILFISKIEKNFRILSHYLKSVGWVPYFWIIVFSCLFVLSLFWTPSSTSKHILDISFLILDILNVIFVFSSLLYAICTALITKRK